MGGRGSGSGNLSSPVIQPVYGVGNNATKGYSITDAQKKALYDYTEGSSINGRLGAVDGDVTQLDEDDQRYVKNLADAMKYFGWNKTQHGTGLIRGGGGIIVGVPTTMKFGSAQQLADWINNNRIGTRNMNVGYTSITEESNVHTAGMFSNSYPNGIIIEYDRIGKGMRGVYVSGKGGADKTNQGGYYQEAISAFGGAEKETLLQRNVVTIPRVAYVGDDGRCHVVVWAYPKGKNMTGDTNKGI
ncbi:MAG: hypothetical protein IKE23_06480 [Exiguobacterium sp.]|nr:hypothetical protein [Exiguobacterium sp.]